MGRIDMQDELPSSIQKSVKEKVFKIKIMIFTEGTVLKPPSVFQHFNHESYLPIGNAASLISVWEAQGAEINYLTSRKHPKQIKQIKKNSCLVTSLGNIFIIETRDKSTKILLNLFILTF